MNFSLRSGGLKVRGMQEWEVGLHVLLTSLESLDEELDRRLDKLRTALERVEANEARWKAEQSEALSTEASDAVRNRIESTLASVDLSRQELADQRDELLSLRDRLVDPMANLARTLKQLRTKIRDGTPIH